jgi:adenosylcobinamide kinase/adenosylcobinamide-phosphate guanylyltransferase
MAREYRDLAGWINQQVADVCDRVFYCVAGQAVDLKKMAFSFDDEGAEQWKK